MPDTIGPQLNASMKEAMKSKDKITLLTVRMAPSGGNVSISRESCTDGGFSGTKAEIRRVSAISGEERNTGLAPLGMKREI